MAIREISAYRFTDDDLPDGWVLVGDDAFTITLSPGSHRDIMIAGGLGQLRDMVEAWGPGEYPVPDHLLRRPDEVRDLRRALAFIGPGESDTCTLPTCLQDAVETRRGFPLCAAHAAMLQGWDDLTA